MEQPIVLPAISILSLFDTTKEQRASFVMEVLARLDNGDTDPLKLHVNIKSLGEILDVLLKDDAYREHVLTEAIKRGREFDFGNARINIKETGVKYDYSKCNDVRYMELMDEKRELDEKIKRHENLLKSIPPKGMEVVIGEEVITIYPPAKSSTTSTVVTLK